jgi:hypothetical protein
MSEDVKQIPVRLPAVPPVRPATERRPDDPPRRPPPKEPLPDEEEPARPDGVDVVV